jgi:exopolysaccharide biosynthesis polyprenyl glycosylphosphotransferase
MAIRLQAAPAAARLNLSRGTTRRLYQGVLVGSDGGMLMAAFGLAYWLRFEWGIALEPDVLPSLLHYGRLVAILLPVLLGLFALLRLYDHTTLLGGTSEYARAFNACTTSIMLVVVASFLEPRFLVSRAWLVLAWLLSLLLVLGARFVLRRAAYALRRRGLFTTPALIVGTNGEAAALVEQWRQVGHSGLELVGVVDDGAGVPGQRSLYGLPMLGGLEELPAVVARWEVGEVIVATSALRRYQLLGLFEQMAQLPGVEMRLSSGLYEVLTTGVEVRTIGSVPLLSLSHLRLSPLETLLKTGLDYSLTLLGLVGLLPVLGVIALLVRLDSPGPVLYRRRVLGVGGRPFDAFKFRTMYQEGEQILARHPELAAALAVEHKLKEDPRVTRVGWWLRRTSLDELPQLVNVLRGQMSLVGPRMISPGEVGAYGVQRWNLLTVKPGLTGLWQVSGRSDVSYEQRVRLDLHYIRHYSLWLDLQILLVQTLPAVLKREGAY